MNLTEIAGVMGTEFWGEYSKRLKERREHILHDFYHYPLEEQNQWLRHAQYRGEMEAYDWIMGLPEQIIKDIKNGIHG